MAAREQRPALVLAPPGPRRRAGLVHSGTLARTRFRGTRGAAGPSLAERSPRGAAVARPCASTPTRIPGRIIMTAMEAFEALGVIRWPLTFSLLVVVALALWSLALVRRSAMPGRHAKAWIDAILFWGGFAAISGVLGSLIGIIITFQFIELAGEVRAALVAGGIKVALLSAALGTLILAVASLLWFGLQLRWRMLVAQHADIPA
ncbi:MAG: MotA/TolQ/ExbB proton channel family protein [Gammaproteobacteria bacterium]|nr:MotA/TolQ/ExbB proton channel family protein [Gammaproteobacteria bacterium]MYC52803.1 MotA/TolQ/ExbB proton channel family protein [Gammaproteobacteria bacterium]